MFDDYDAFAPIYNDHWGPAYGRRALPTLRAILRERLERTSRLLDLCCGAGHVSRVLTELGHQVVGIDGSRRLLAYARSNASRAEFQHADARNFDRLSEFDGALCFNDSLNHILTADELRTAFVNVFRSLRPGGWFLFDLNLEHKYRHVEVVALDRRERSRVRDRGRCRTGGSRGVVRGGRLRARRRNLDAEGREPPADVVSCGASARPAELDRLRADRVRRCRRRIRWTTRRRTRLISAARSPYDDKTRSTFSSGRERAGFDATLIHATVL